ncbi:hypothetical protein SKAU_G00021710 [Synaphobranchus kaupii]|uniref:IRS-type PTB domain-containing protein n=1 Tax=Synaphobranchus kaupii TaxID=118154 RepID=A0A9Q1GD56_SYNKA|nr:hypothetical protein SKAU_G00021710 [Synaphobranchus kaupii]
MGSCCSCPDKESIPDNHQSKFKVINVDDDGNELGSGLMELTEEELILHTWKREAVRWPYLCLRRYGYDSNLFSFESGRRCQTGQGIFAFKCARAEEIFNMLQDIMHNNSISVVEEPVIEPAQGATEGEVHTYVNTTGMQEDWRSHSSVHPPIDLQLSDPEATAPPDVPEPRVLLEPTGVKFVLGPTPVQKQLMAKERRQEDDPVEQVGGARDLATQSALPFGSLNGQSGDGDTGYDSDERKDAPTGGNPAYEHLNGSAPRRIRPPMPSPDPQNANNSAQRRTALLNYENLPALPPVWEAPKPSSGGEDVEEEEEDDTFGPKTPSLNGYHHPPPPPPPACAGPGAQLRGTARLPPTVFNFDFRRPGLPESLRQLNYIEVEMEKEKGSDSSGPHTPKTPTTPLPQTPTRRTELYAVIDIERTAAMSSLQKALPRDDGTSRKTRHNSTDLPM